MQGAGCRVQGSGCRVQGSGCRRAREVFDVVARVTVAGSGGYGGVKANPNAGWRFSVTSIHITTLGPRPCRGRIREIFRIGGGGEVFDVAVRVAGAGGRFSSDLSGNAYGYSQDYPDKKSARIGNVFSS